MHKSLLILFAAVVCAFSGYAQTITASITGTIADPSGAVVPGVKVTATNTSTNNAYNATTNESGVYNLLFSAGRQL